MTFEGLGTPTCSHTAGSRTLPCPLPAGSQSETPVSTMSINPHSWQPNLTVTFACRQPITTLLSIMASDSRRCVISRPTTRLPVAERLPCCAQRSSSKRANDDDANLPGRY